MKTYKDGAECSDFTADDTITVKATPTATGEAPANSAMFAASFTGPGAGQMAVFVNETQVSEPADAVDGSYTMTVSAADVLLAAGGPGTEIPLSAKFVGNDNMADGAGTATVNITAVAKAEKDGKVIGYYGESGLDAALANSGNEGAVFTLLDNMERETDLRINISCTLDLNGKTIRSTGEYVPALSTYYGTAVTIRGDGTVTSEHGNGLSVGGTATLEGGNFISGTADYGGVSVGGKLIVTGENVVMRNTGNGNGLSVNSGTGATAQLSAGTCEGGAAAVKIYGSTGTLAGLLNQAGTSRVAYYKDNTTLVTEGLDGQTLPGGSYTVKACTHIFGSSPTCLACGEQAVARVTIGDAVTHYGDLPSAWAAVQGQTADLYLLKSVDAAGVGKYNRLDLASGSVTLGMADGVILTGSNQDAVIFLEGGELTLNSGTIRNSHTYGLAGLRVQSGTLHINGGTVVANDEGVFVVSGQVEITGGTFTGNNGIGFHRYEGTVKISGGQFSGSREAVYNSNGTLADLLAEGYAFKQGGAWVTDTSGDSLTGTVTAEPAPVKITAQPVNTSQHYGDMDALSIETSPGQDGSVTYQWYVVKASGAEAVSGEIAPVFFPSENQRLDVGSYQYFCEVTKDSYTLRSNTVTFTVTPRQVNPSITGTAHKEYDGTTNVTDGQLFITLEGVVTGDDVTATATSYAYDNANAGENKTITASGIALGGADAGNYELSSTTATTTGTITKSQPTIAFAGGYNPSKDYDGQTIPNPTADDLTITGANFSDVTFEWSATPKDAGTYTLTANIPETDNTAAASTSPLTVTISKATLTATSATVASKPYDGTDTAIVTGVTFTGLVNGETLALGTDYTATGKFDSASAGTGKSVTVTVTLADTAKANNYDLTPNTTTATSTITKASSTITTAPTATGITYGQALSDSALTGGGAVSGDTTIAGTWNWTAPDTKPNAGTAQYEVTFMPTDTNYDTATVNVTVTVAKATPTLTAPTAGAIQYGQKLSNSTLTGGTATNPNDSATVAGSWSWASGNTRPTADGDFPVAFVPSDTANYNAPGNVDASVTVTPAAPKITLAVPAYQVANGVVEVKYTAANPHDATLNDLPAVTLTYKVGSGAEQPITDGKFTIPEGTAVDTVITVTASTAAVDGKYTAATKTATVTVTDKIPVEISGVGVTGRAYNGKAINHTGIPVIKTLDGKTVTDATVTYTWSSGGDTGPINAGNYTLTISVDGEKYIGSTTVDFTIEKATVTITAVNKSAVVGSAQPELTYTVSGLADGETLTTAPTLTCTPDMNTVGSYPITASGAAVSNTGNYNTTITYVDGTLSVTAKPSTGGGGYVPSNPGGSTITVPVSGDKSTVRVSASVSGTTATVSKIDTTQIENVIGDNGQASMVEIDFTGLGKTIDTVKPPAAAIKDIAAKAQNEEVGGLTVKLPEAEISFDANALSAIQAQAGSQITLTVTPAKPADLNSRQKEAVGNAPVFNLTLRSSSGAITDFRGGYATVSLPYTLAAGQNPSGVVVYYLDSTGNITPCPTMYDVRSKSAIFTTGHLSLYFVGYDPAAVWVNPFSDVAGDAWYYDAVRYASENGLMGGYGNGMFGPNDNLSRAQFAQILFNKEGRPVVNYLLRYNDVADGAWYTEAVRWATSQGVVSGYGNGMFGPNDIITREQLAVMLWRYAGSPAATDKELHFTDADQASGFALEALRWAVENSIINGKSGGILDPQGLATRAEAAQILKNFLGK